MTMKTTKKIAGHAVALALTLIGLFAATGCGTVQPYERGKLAHPTMTAADMAGFGESHLRAISEGAIGGSGGTGSGCGCN
jgi:Domain of unknown function (DUF4266)